MNKEQAVIKYTSIKLRFISTPSSLIVAPAGFGKSHVISDLVKDTDLRILILTHTNAGVASLKQKIINKKNVKAHYTISTIDGFTKKYIEHFVNKNTIPYISLEDKDAFYKSIRSQFSNLLESNLVKKIITLSYDHVIIDEYQDCNIAQHQIVVKISRLVSTHILGDPLQSIFNFKEQVVPWSTVENDFNLVGELDFPWRWERGGNLKLGEDIGELRNDLINKISINLKKYKSFKIHKCDPKPNDDFYKILSKSISQSSNSLIIHSDSIRRKPRTDIISRLNYLYISFIEAVDASIFYEKANIIENIDKSNIYESLIEILAGKVNNEDGKVFFGVVSGTGMFPRDVSKFKIKKLSPLIKESYETFVSEGSLNSLLELLTNIKRNLDLLGKRAYASYELYTSIIYALQLAITKNISVINAMKLVRDQARSKSRSILGRAIGTTLLTKGLEAENVIILYPENYKDPHNFYVACSRASKNLIIVTACDMFNPYKESKPEQLSIF